MKDIGVIISRVEKEGTPIHREMFLKEYGKMDNVQLFDLVNGKGTYKYFNGARYEGEWYNGKQNGEGTEYYP